MKVTFAYSQVTFGSTEKPEDGALLQLKNIDGVIDGSANSTKGLSLPRVKLSSINNLYPLIDIAESNQNENYIGAMVYNVNDRCSNVYWNNNTPYVFSVGVVVWDGNLWAPLVNEKFIDGVGFMTDIDGNTYSTMDYGDAGIWMTENLRVRHYDTESEVYNTPFATDFENWTGGWRSGVGVPAWAYSSSPGTDGKDPKYFNLDPSIGLQYNAYAALGMTVGSSTYSTRQGICPNGWQIPNASEYTKLGNVINENPSLYSRSNIEGSENFISNCDVIDLGNNSSGINILLQGRSLEAYRGGFALKAYGTNNGTVIGYDFVYASPNLWTRDKSKSAGIQGTAGIRFTQSTNFLTSGATGSSSNLFVIRCIKK